MKRFGDHNLFIGLYAEKLVSTKRARDDDSESFRRVVDDFECCLRKLEQVVTEMTATTGISARQMQNIILAPILLRKLPTATRIEWARRQTSPDSLLK